MNQKERQSQFELLKILAMVMIVAHHFVAKNAFNVDTDIVGLSFNKLFLQFIGNHAFIGNNLFFMCSAWFLVSKAQDFDSFPRSQLRHIWTMEKPMLLYGITSWLVFRVSGGGYSDTRIIGKINLPNVDRYLVVSNQLHCLSHDSAVLSESPVCT